jgi:hypothetical protein
MEAMNGVMAAERTAVNASIDQKSRRQELENMAAAMAEFEKGLAMYGKTARDQTGETLWAKAQTAVAGWKKETEKLREQVGKVQMDDVQHLETVRPGSGGEIQLTDGIASLLRREQVLAYEFHGTRYDCGSKLGYLKATVEHALKHPEVADEFRAYLAEFAGKL